jgi:hypothetical protein
VISVGGNSAAAQGVNQMKTMTCVLAILAAASTAALAKDLKQDQKTTAPGISAMQMNDAEMDKVTAGRAFPSGGPDNQVTLPFQASPNAIGAGRGNAHSFGGRAADHLFPN